MTRLLISRGLRWGLLPVLLVATGSTAHASSSSPCNMRALQFESTIHSGDDFIRVGLVVSNPADAACTLRFPTRRLVEYGLTREGGKQWTGSLGTITGDPTTLELPPHFSQTFETVKTDLEPSELHGRYTLHATLLTHPPLAVPAYAATI